MYYVIVPQELCERRKVFTKNPRTPDGRVVVTLNELGLTRFSYGVVELVNGDDLRIIMSGTPSTQDTTASGKEE